MGYQKTKGQAVIVISFLDLTTAVQIIGDIDSPECRSPLWPTNGHAAWPIDPTKLAGDEIKSDKIDDLLVALTRVGKLTPRDMSKLVVAHHRSLATV